MASDFIGDTILVTLIQPPNAQIQGVVADVVNQKLHLQNVTLLWNNQHLPNYILDASVIADLEVSASPLPLPPPLARAANVPNVPAPTTTPSTTATAPAGSVPRPAEQQFVDPAILSYSKPPNGPSLVVDAANVAAAIGQPVSPVMIADGAVPSPPCAQPEKRAPAVPSSLSSLSARQTILPLDEPLRRDSVATAILTEPFDALALKTDVLQRDNPKTKIKKAKQQQQPPPPPPPPCQLASGPGIVVSQSTNGNPALAAPTVVKKAAKGKAKGWRKTPLIEEVPKTVATRHRGRRADEQNGWATEDATDVQDLGDFDFEANLSKFNKRQVFDDLRRDDPIAYEDRLVGFNRKARPGTNGGRNLHFTENVLDSADTWRSEAGETDDGTNDNSNSRGSKTAAAASWKPTLQSSRKGSLLTLRGRADSPGPLSRVATSPMNGSLSGIRASFRLPNNKSCHCVSPLQMLEIEQLCTSELGLTEDMLAENAGRSIAEAVLKSGRDVRNLVVLVGNHKSGARAIAAARHLRNRRLRVTVVILGGERDELLQEIVRKQLNIYKKGQGYVDRWDEFKAKMDSGAAPMPDVVIDALLGLHLSFDELRSDDAATCFEMIKWATRTERVVSIDVPSGLSAQSGLYTEAEGQMLVMESKQVIALGAPKTGLLHAMALDGPDCSWTVTVADIGISIAAWQKHGSRRRHGIDFGNQWTVQLNFVAG